MSERKRPIVVVLMAVAHVVIAVALAYLAMVAFGRLPDARDQIDPYSAFGTFYRTYEESTTGNAPLLGRNAAIFAFFEIVIAIGQFFGKGFGWTFGALSSLIGILWSSSIFYGDLQRVQAQEPFTWVGLGGIAVFVTFLAILVSPSVQAYFGRFETRG